MYKYIKRFFDIVASLLAIILLSPLLIFTSIMVRIKLGKPVFFIQERPGKDEKIFNLYKFRTMADIRDENGELVCGSLRKNKFGDFLRSASIDELPELFNILKGDMSFIGPRPLLVKYLPRYNEHQHRRHEVKPGLSGWAQVNGRNAISWDEKFDLDVEYVDNISFSLDIKIFFMTIFNVFKREGINAENCAEISSGTMPEFMGTLEEETEAVV